MSSTLKHKGFQAVIEYDADERVLVGRVIDIDALILFSAHSPDEIEPAFHEAIEEYIEDCKNRGVDCQKPCSGTFNVRVGAELHRKALELARRSGESLNSLIMKALASEVDRRMNAAADAASTKRFVFREVTLDTGWVDAMRAGGVEQEVGSKFDLPTGERRHLRH